MAGRLAGLAPGGGKGCLVVGVAGTGKVCGWEGVSSALFSGERSSQSADVVCRLADQPFPLWGDCGMTRLS